MGPEPCGRNPWGESLGKKGAECPPTSRRRGCLLGGQRRKHSSTCLGVFTCTRTRGTRRKVISHTAMLAKEPQRSSPRQGPETTRTQEGPNDEKHTCRLPQGWFCSSRQRPCPRPAGPGTPRCLSPQHRSPSHRSDGDLTAQQLPHPKGENDTSPHTATREGSGEPHSPCPSMDSWVGPSGRGAADKQLSPAGQGGGWGVPAGGGRAGLRAAGACGPARIAGHTRGRMAGGDGGGGGDRKVRPWPPRERAPTQNPGNSRPEVPSASAAGPGSLRAGRVAGALGRPGCGHRVGWSFASGNRDR